MNRFEAIGNLGAAPEKKTVQVKGEERQLVTLRCYFSVPRPNADGEFDDDLDRGFWCDVEIWKESLGNRVFRHLKKGSRVFVRGTLLHRTWQTKDGEDRETYSIQADYVAADLIGIAAITYGKDLAEQGADDHASAAA